MRLDSSCHLSYHNEYTQALCGNSFVIDWFDLHYYLISTTSRKSINLILNKYIFLKANYIILMQGFLFWGLHITEITSEIMCIYNIFLGRMTIPLVKFSGILGPNKYKFLIPREPREY